MSSFKLFEDNALIAVDKPLGMSSALGNSGLDAKGWLTLHHHLELEEAYVLPSEMSGVLLFSKHEKELSGLECECVFWSSRFVEEGELSSVDSFEIRHVSSHGECHLYSVTGGIGILEGLREQLASAGLPILGDVQNGGQAWGRLALHCSRIGFEGSEDSITASFPPSFLALKRDASKRALSLAFCEDRRLGWPKSITNAFRVVHRDEVGHAAYAAEVYGAFLSVWSYDEEASVKDILELLKPDIEHLMEVYQCKGALVRLANRDPHNKRLVRSSQWIGESCEEPFYIQEHGLEYEISLKADKHSGLFLDQRDSRRRVAKEASGKRMANLFSFTCSFSQAAIAERAEVVFSVDLAGGCLQTGKDNLAKNQLDGLRIGKFVQEDVRLWLQRQLRRKKRDGDAFVPFDLIVCDPPVFAGAKKQEAFSVEEAWPELVTGCVELLAEGGIALFANNHRSGDEGYYRGVLEEHFNTVEPLGQSIDFPLLKNIHARTYWCRS